jgi:hypothetical protein
MKKKIAGHQPRSPILHPSKIAMGDKIMKPNLAKQIYLNGPKMTQCKEKLTLDLLT